jgi:hypothetical protein
MGLIFAMTVAMAVSCGEKKEARLAVTEQEFIIRQDTDHSWVVDAKGKIKNVGEVDVKNIVVTGFCTGCGKKIINGRWFISDYEKMEHQKDTINYLVPGAEESFSFEEVAFMQGFDPEPARKKPEGLEVEIVSFEIAGK